MTDNPLEQPGKSERADPDLADDESVLDSDLAEFVASIEPYDRVAARLQATRLIQAGQPSADETSSRLHRSLTRLTQALSRPVARATTLPMTEAEFPVTFGRFRLLQCLGSGGFAIVFLAEDSLLKRKVALKVPRSEMLASTDLLSRFIREFETLATLNHRHIVSIFDVGHFEQTPFLVMEYCDGGNLADWVTQHREQLTPQRCAQILHKLALAVEHAHLQGVLHRDLKPRNVLLQKHPQRQTLPSSVGDNANPTGDDEDVVMKLSDFGLAKWLEPRDAQDHTKSGTIMGTPKYLSPEQAAGHTEAIGPATDVYALGILLYELLTGRVPFSGNSELETLRQIQSFDPPQMSLFRPDVPRDLETICRKCLAKEPGRRYFTARELADDLQRFLLGQPIRARRPSAWERTSKWTRRHPAWATLMCMIAVTMAAIPLALSWHARETVQVHSELGKALRREQQLTELSEAQQHELLQQETRLARVAYASKLRELGLLVNSDQIEHAQVLLRDIQSQASADCSLDFTWNYWRNTIVGRLGFLQDQPTKATCMAWSPDGTWLVSGNEDGDLTVWKGTPPRAEQTHDVSSASLRLIAISPDQRLIAVGDIQRVVSLWDAATWDRLFQWKCPGGHLTDLRFSADGRWLYVADHTTDIKVVDVPARMLSPTGPKLTANSWQVAPCPTRDLVITSDFQCIQFWNPVDWKPRRRLECPNGPVTSIALSDDGTQVAFGDHLGLIRVWDLDRSEFVTEFPTRSADDPQYDVLTGLNFSRDRQSLFWCAEKRLVVWDIERRTELRSYPVPRRASAARSPDGAFLAFQAEHDELAFAPLNREDHSTESIRHQKEAWAVAFHPTEPWLFTGSDDHTARIWNLETGEELAVLRGHEATVTRLAISSDGGLLATASLDGTAKLWDIASRSERGTLKGHLKGVRSIALSPDGAWVATAASDGTAKVWSAKTGELLRTLKLSDESRRTAAVAFSHDGKLLATASGWEAVTLWNTSSWQAERTLPSSRPVHSLQFSPDDRSLATGNSHGLLQLWDVPTGTARLAINGHADSIRSVTFSPSGRMLATASVDHAVKLWDLETAQELAEFATLGSQVNDVAFAPKEDWLAASMHDGRVQFWDGRSSTEAFWNSKPRR